MASGQLEIWNNALGLCEEPALTSTTPVNEAGRQCADKWPAAVKACFELGTWNFAILRAQLNTTAAPAFGYQCAYQLPADLIRIVFISDTGSPANPLESYANENGAILTDASAVYLAYVSSSFMTNYGAWTGAFADYVAGELAQRIAPKLSSADNIKQAVAAEHKRRKALALGFDAQQQPKQRDPMGKWARAPRTGYHNSEQAR